MAPERPADRSSYQLVQWIVVRGMGLVYLAAFVSLWIQIRGLVGDHGIMPVRDLLDQARPYFDARGIGLDRYRLLPTLSWLSASDAWLVAQCAAGALVALFVVADIAPALCLALAWLLYLSLATAGQDFLAFQWDNLLLEAGLIAIAFAPWRLWPRRGGDDPPVAARWLLRWLLFRLMFESGCVKLLSGDVSWRDLTALTYHYQTQPLPTWVGWHANLLPVWFQKASCALVFAVELGVPWLILTTRRLRAIACAALVGLQVLILLTGNYAFFNALTIVLCLTLVDDRAIARWMPAGLRQRLAPAAEPARVARAATRTRLAVAVAFAVVIVPISAGQLIGMLGLEPVWFARAVVAGDEWTAPLRSVNRYGLFAMMTTRRAEITIEGSDDGFDWRAYRFKDKPDDVMRRPGFIAPYQPRLDWQMWFAALGTSRTTPWFVPFCARLLEGSPQVLALLATNPFPDHPPRFIRATMDDYRFTTAAERRTTGAWWARTPVGDYLEPISLRR